MVYVVIDVDQFIYYGTLKVVRYVVYKRYFPRLEKLVLKRMDINYYLFLLCFRLSQGRTTG